MNKYKIDNYIKNKVDLDKQISTKAENMIKRFREDLIMKEENKERKVIKISLNKVLAIAVCFMITAFLGVNIYSNSKGRPNVFSTIQALITKEDKQNIVVEENTYNLKIFVGNKSNPTEGLKDVKVTIITAIGDKEPQQKEDIYTNNEGLATIPLTKEIENSSASYTILINSSDNSSKIGVNITYENYKPVKVIKGSSDDNGEIKYLGVTDENDVEIFWYFYDEEDTTNNTNATNVINTTNTSNTTNTTNTSNNTTTLYGDANCDGKVDLKDSTYIERYLASWKGYTLTTQGKINADVNRDDAVEQFDANIIKEYLAGNYSSLPVKLTNTEWITKGVPGMNLKYPSDWIATEINKNNWNFQQGKASCKFEGYIGGTQVIIIIFEPEYRNIYDYSELMKQEANKNDIEYNEFTGSTGYNLFDSDAEHLTWRELLLPDTQGGMKSRNLYNINSIGWVTKINLAYNSPSQEETIKAWRVIDEIIASITFKSY